MENFGNSYDTLIAKLDEFIRKYYKNQLIRGILYAVGILVSGFLVMAVLEYFAHFDRIVRTILFWSFLVATGTVLTRFVFIPIFKLNRIGKIISHDAAAAIIGKHFTNVQDKLLNVLQLRRTDVSGGTSPELIQASIDQKIRELKPVPFTSAIDLSQNRRYAKYALIPLALIIIIIFTNAGIITESTNRLVHPGDEFIDAPFNFEVNQNKDLKAVENEDFPIEVKLTGKEIPESVFILVDGNEYKLNRENTINFNYTFRNIQKSKTFRLSADGFTSKEYAINVMPNPIVLNFDVELHYPKYIKKKDETVKNTGDLVVPAGTNITWKFNTRATKKFLFAFSDTSYALNPTSDNAFSFSQRFLESRNYSLHTSNEFLKSKDSIRYSINVIPDLYPAISIDEKKDSVSRLKMYFTGEVKDDYGFTKLAFVYHTLNKKDSTGKEIPEKIVTTNINVSNSLQRDQFYYYWDLSQLGIAAGDQIEYYFEVWDNDGVHGAKSTRSQRMVYHAPTAQELKDQNESDNKKTEQDLEASLADAQALQKEIDDLHKKLMEKKSLSWEDKKKIEDLKNKQKDLQEKIDKLKEQQAKNSQQQAEFQPNDPTAAAKAEELQKLFDQLATEDMKKMLAQLEQLLQNADKDKTQKTLDDMKQENKDTEKDIDRTLNLFRDMQVQQKLDDAIKNLNDLQKQQDSLSKQSAEMKNPSKAEQQDMKNKQDTLNKKFQEFRQEMDKIEEENNKLDQPHDIPNTDLNELQIQQQQQEGSQNLNEGSPKKASQSQKSAADKMSELSSELQAAQKAMDEEEQAEDMMAIKQLLSNLLQLSFDQEALMDKVKNTSVNDPQYVTLAREQKKLRDDSKMIEDSLLALSKRNPNISPAVNKSITDINMNMDRSMQALGERNTAEASSREQMSMKSINDLALMLNESLEQMMQQANAKSKSQCSGNGKCNKPGNGKKNKPGMSSLRKMQQGINGQMEQMMKDGKDGKPGGTSEQLAKLAAQQEYIRRMLQESMKAGQDGQGGPDPGGQTQAKMEETENDLVNKQINAETLKRQQDILDKMLEYEKAEQQKEMDEQRQSNEAKNQQESNPAGFSEYNSQKQKEAELLKTVPPALSPFYKNKVNTYFNGVQQ